MNEKEKMIAGCLYNANDKQLVEERLVAKDIAYDINMLRPVEVVKRKRLFNKLLSNFHDTSYIEPPFYCDYGYNIKTGEHFYANHNLLILDAAPVTIGNHVFIAPNVSIFTATHPIDANERATEYEYAYPVHIGNDVWIGGNTVINPGVSIGNDVVIGSGSVVTKDIPDHVVAAGNPCRILRAITADDRKLK